MLEGTIGQGNKGDIAVDDLAVLDGNCATAELQSKRKKIPAKLLLNDISIFRRRHSLTYDRFKGN